MQPVSRRAERRRTQKLEQKAKTTTYNLTKEQLNIAVREQVGKELERIKQDTPGNIVAIRPLKEGVIANYTITQKMLEYVVNKVAGKSFFSKPRIMVQ